MGQATSENRCNSLIILSNFHSLNHSVYWQQGELCYGNLRLVWADLKLELVIPVQPICELFCERLTLVAFIQLAPACVIKPRCTMASGFKPGYPSQAQNCTYVCKMIINALLDGKILTDWFNPSLC